MNRLHSLDYLRGIAAFLIMIYHYYSWTIAHLKADSFLGRMGLYGVSIFYILSGLTLFVVYSKKWRSGTYSIKSFFVKRVFRIFPLLWLSTIISILLLREPPDIYKLLLNLTGLFGFVDWDNYFATGVWSIGNELTFYCLFPFMLYFSFKKKMAFYLIIILTFICYIYFAFFLYSNTDLSWNLYVNPLNQVFLFSLGILIARNLTTISINSLGSIALIFLGILFFIFYPSSELRVNIVSGVNRLIFTFFAIIICVGFFKLKIILPDIFHRPLRFLGEISYSLYLLHPICFSFVGALSSLIDVELPIYMKLILSLLSTLILSYIVYERFEKYFITKGYYILDKISLNKS